jgi:hypothetical protein
MLVTLVVTGWFNSNNNYQDGQYGVTVIINLYDRVSAFLHNENLVMCEITDVRLTNLRIRETTWLENFIYGRKKNH